MLLYEGGEARRFGPRAVDIGVAGTLRTLECLDMCSVGAPEGPECRTSRETRWIRASRSGILHLDVAAGDRIEDGERMALISNSFGDRKAVVRCRTPGIVIGHTLNPLVNRGDALVHLARVEE